MSEKYLESCPTTPEQSIPQDFFNALEKFEIKDACDLIWDRINKLDKRIQETEPFKVVKVDLEKGKNLFQK